MQLSKETVDVLKNFASINMSILIRPGHLLRTISPQKNVMALANIAESFPIECGIYDLNQFLSSLSLFDGVPEINFDKNSMKIKSPTGSSIASITYASKEAIVFAPDKDINLPNIEISFKLDDSSLLKALKAAAVFSLPEIAFVGRGGQTYITSTNSKESSSNFWEERVGTSDSSYRMIFRLDSLKLLPRNYHVDISSKGISKFTSMMNDVTYFLATEAGSSFQG